MTTKPDQPTENASESDATACSTAYFTVVSCGERREIIADEFLVSQSGLRFLLSGETVAWFTEWSSFEKLPPSMSNAMSRDNLFDILAQHGFTTRARNVLIRQLKCNTIADVLNVSLAQLEESKNCGPGCLSEIIEKRKKLSP